MYSIQEIEEILSILDYHFLHVFSTQFGVSGLSNEEVGVLTSHGINVAEVGKELSTFDRMFLLGKLSAILSDEQLRQLPYKDFNKYIRTGQYQPLTKREQYEIDIARKKTYVHLKGIRGKSRGEFETILLDKTGSFRKKYEEAITDETAKGVALRRTNKEIISELGHRMDVWNHDWNRIVETEMNNIFQEGRAVEIAKKHGEDAIVYKDVYAGACRHCIEKYLTNGYGSKPRTFKLKDLIANGTNIGKKVKEWVATLWSLHPHCRCTLNVVPKGYQWNEAKKTFEIPKDFERKVERKSKIYIHIGDKKFEI